MPPEESKDLPFGGTCAAEAPGKGSFPAFVRKNFPCMLFLSHLWKILHVCSEKLARLWDLGIVICFVSNYNISAY